MTLIFAPKPATVGDALEDLDVAKALVTAEFDRMVEEGRAAMITLEAGTLELRLATGEIFHLGETAITRVA
jgi:hypothetical protein